MIKAGGRLSILAREAIEARPWLASPLFQAAILAAVTVLVLFLRRPDQFLHPYIWVEEGKYVLREYLNGGLWVLTKPLAGYSQLVVEDHRLSLLQAVHSLGAGDRTFLTVAFSAGVVIAVALSPTYLRWPFLCAIAVLVVPTDAEVFAISAYAFWWAGVLLFLAVLWDADRGERWLRWLFILLGGLSSPILGAATMLIALRAVVERRRSEFLALGVAISGRRRAGLRHAATACEVFRHQFGFDTVAARSSANMSGFFIAMPASFSACSCLPWRSPRPGRRRARLDRYFYLLVLMFFVVAFVISLRLRTFGIDKFDTAPRYFFYPFILFSWILIWIAAVSTRPVRMGIAAAFAIALLVAGTGLSRRHDAVDWRAHLLACAKSDEYEMPFHYIGKAKKMWEVPSPARSAGACSIRAYFEPPLARLRSYLRFRIVKSVSGSL